MKKSLYSLLFIAVIVLLPSCKKDNRCRPKAPASELAQIQAYAAANGINAQPDPSGMYYEIVSMGTGPKASVNSKIVITYTGKLMNGQIFDEMVSPNTMEPWPLNGLIKGWIIGIPLINKGGHIKLIVPSSLAYGCEQYYSIPGNSVLFFDIQLVDVQ